MKSWTSGLNCNIAPTHSCWADLHIVSLLYDMEQHRSDDHYGAGNSNFHPSIGRFAGFKLKLKLKQA